MGRGLVAFTTSAEVYLARYKVAMFDLELQKCTLLTALVLRSCSGSVLRVLRAKTSRGEVSGAIAFNKCCTKLPPGDVRSPNAF